MSNSLNITSETLSVVNNHSTHTYEVLSCVRHSNKQGRGIQQPSTTNTTNSASNAHANVKRDTAEVEAALKTQVRGKQHTRAAGCLGSNPHVLLTSP